MPAYKDKKTGKWNVQFYIKTFEGKNKKIFKRSFKTKKEALEYEQNYKAKNQGSVTMKFKDFVKLYLEENKTSVKEMTTIERQNKIRLHFTPYLGNFPINEIKSIHIKKLQNNLLEKGLSESYVNRLLGELRTIFNYAVSYYGLKENPCTKVKNLKVLNKREMKIWTVEQFNEFLSHVKEVPFKVAFETLFYTGLRIGELTALTLEDIDFSVPKIIVNKSLRQKYGKEVTSSPKTRKSNREIIIPETLAKHIQEYVKQIYGITPKDRIFYYNQSSYGNKLRSICKEFDLEKIKIHEFRHSHASLLIESNFNPVVIADRLGHEDIKETLNTYSHLYPNKQNEIATYLESSFF